jgi:tetrathionate reductase subunit B
MVACKTEHQIPTGKHAGHEYYRISVLEYEKGKYPTVTRVFAPVLCMQCEVAPCMDVCPISGAIYRRQDGIVVVNQNKCNGCKLCMNVCPYDALYFNEEVRGVDKCDFCVDRLDQGLEPACVATCMGRAMVFGDLDDPQSEVSKRVAMGVARYGGSLFPTYFGKTFKPSVFYAGSASL